MATRKINMVLSQAAAVALETLAEDYGGNKTAVINGLLTQAMKGRQAMTWEQAVQILAARSQYSDAERDGAIERVCRELYESDRYSRGDWVAEGTWDGSETVGAIKAEWDEYCTPDSEDEDEDEDEE